MSVEQRIRLWVNACSQEQILRCFTCRDFPQEELDKLVAAQQASSGQSGDSAGDEDGVAPLNPWQAHTACLLPALAVT